MPLVAGFFESLAIFEMNDLLQRPRFRILKVTTFTWVTWKIIVIEYSISATRPQEVKT